ncbi:hypothetical protein LJ655_24805 [Paraburkholderia sp. MMS20-SJTN17]|uniref:Uncharacterized protein n=1 Tax=Paraburkholderia translucens TaxID=2886945 RepID=A0ABS8KJY3_9BURK|nr:hypothetical protein [Paraburkholderia sp. MMS20-SJTN17]MCC8405058.1 hypothetical protein [Paraburkholderia sp. MMS20-SJTN17]
MSFARRSSPSFPSCLPRIALACGAALLLANAVDAAPTAEPNQPADIAACFAQVVHDVNTPVLQHFIVTTDTRRVNVTASVQGQNELRLRVTR